MLVSMLAWRIVVCTKYRDVIDNLRLLRSSSILTLIMLDRLQAATC